MVTGGDHTVVFGHVVGPAHALTSPLTYYQRRFGTHLAHQDRDEDQGGASALQADLRYLPGLPDEASSWPAFAGDSLEELFAFS